MIYHSSSLKPLFSFVLLVSVIVLPFSNRLVVVAQQEESARNNNARRVLPSTTTTAGIRGVKGGKNQRQSKEQEYQQHREGLNHAVLVQQEQRVATRALQKKGSQEMEECVTFTTMFDLENAINSASASSNPDDRIITVCPGTIAVLADSKDFVSLANPVTVRCSQPKACFIVPGENYGNGGPMTRVFDGVALSFDGIVVSGFDGGDGNGGKGVFAGYGAGTSLTFTNCEFYLNQNMGGGGVIMGRDGSTINIVSCTFRSNKSSGYGGALSVDKSILNVIQSRFDTNLVLSDGGYGGAISALRSTVNIEKSTFESNSISTNGRGGALAHRGGELIIEKSKFEQNMVSTGPEAKGGAIFLQGFSDQNMVATFENADFGSNQVSDDGGAMYIDVYSFVQLKKGCSFDKNIAGGSGGAIFVNVPSGSQSGLSVSKTKFKRNVASSKSECNNVYYNNVGGRVCGP